jgi:hypothetical protein
MWRELYPLAGQKAPCWLKVHVFTRLSEGAPPASRGSSSSSSWDSSRQGQGGRRLQQQQQGRAGDSSLQDSVNSSSSRQAPILMRFNSSSSSGGVNAGTPEDAATASSSATASPSVWDLPPGFVLHRSYTIRFIPLRPPEQLSLRAITFSNNATTVIACGVPEEYEHLFVLPRALQPLPQQPSVAAAAGAESGPRARPSSIMSANYGGEGLDGMWLRGRNSSSAAGNRTQQARNSSTPAPAGSKFHVLDGDNRGGAAAPAVAVADAADGSSSSSSSDSDGQPARLTAAPGVDVQVAYLIIKPASKPGSSDAGPSTTAGPAAAAAAVGAVARLPPSRLRQEQYSVFDRATNRTIVWSKFTSSECAQDRYILLPMAQLKPDMRMLPELLDPEGLEAGVSIAMSAAAVALSGSLSSASAGSSSSGGGGAASNGSSSAAAGIGGGTSSITGGAVAVPGDGSSSPSSWLLGKRFQGGGFGGSSVAAVAAAAAVDGGEGLGGLGQGSIGQHVWCPPGSSSSSSSSNSSGLAQPSKGLSGGSSSSGDSGGGGGCQTHLPGLTAEMPIILAADEGRSSKTYTLLLYSNARAAAAARDLILPQEAAAAASAAAAAADGAAVAGANGTMNQQAADAAALSAAYFAARPPEWPRSPAQSSQCSVCPNGTYSTHTDSLECKVRVWARIGLMCRAVVPVQGCP